MKLRDQFQKGIYVVINPLVRLLIRLGLTPNMVTAIGALISIGASGMVVYAGMEQRETNHLDTNVFTWAAIIMFVGCMFDMLDGQVARLGGMTTRFGAMLDSILDKYTEMVTLLAISFYFFAIDEDVWGGLTFFSTVGGIMVSYVRARAEGVGLECKVGFMQRPERIVVTCIGCLLTGLFSCIEILEWSMAFIALFANLTALWRIDYCRRQLKE